MARGAFAVAGRCFSIRSYSQEAYMSSFSRWSQLGVLTIVVVGSPTQSYGQLLYGSAPANGTISVPLQPLNLYPTAPFHFSESVNGGLQGDYALTADGTYVASYSLAGVDARLAFSTSGSTIYTESLEAMASVGITARLDYSNLKDDWNDMFVFQSNSLSISGYITPGDKVYYYLGGSVYATLGGGDHVDLAGISYSDTLSDPGDFDVRFPDLNIPIGTLGSFWSAPQGYTSLTVDMGVVVAIERVPSNTDNTSVVIDPGVGVTAVPEPSSGLMAGIGILAALALARRPARQATRRT